MANRHRNKRSGLLDHPARLLSGVATLLALGWIWLVANLHLHEMIVGVVVVALSTAFCALVLRSATLPLELRPRDLLQIWRVPYAIVKDSGILTAVLFRDIFGSQPAGSFYRMCGFRSSLRDPVLVARSALAVMYTTMSPNMIVIGIDATQSHMLFHQLQRDEVPALAQELGAQR